MMNLGRLRPGALYVLPGAALAVVLAIIVSKVIFKAPEYDEAEVLHASWLIARGGKMWVDIFEHHSPLFNTINAWLFPDSIFFVLYAKCFCLTLYLLQAYLFSVACYLWLGVPPAFRLSFCVYAVVAYSALTWPVDIGVIRPENYSMFSLMAGSVSGYYVGKTCSFRSYTFAFWTVFFLALSLSFSPRSVFLDTGVGLAVLWTLRGRQDWAIVLVAMGLGGCAVILLNLMIAPLSGFYLWMVDFNLHLRPYRRLWQASYGSVAVGVFLVFFNALLIFVKIAAAGSGRLGALMAGRPASWVSAFADCRLLVAQLGVIVCWLYVFADQVWGRQSFGAVAVASSFCVVVLAAATFRIAETASGNVRAGNERAGRGDDLGAWVRTALRRPLARSIGILLALALVSGAGAVLYLSVDKVRLIIARLQPSGMLRDMSLAVNEKSFRLRAADELLPLSEAKNLGEWLLWSKRYCELFRNDRILAMPLRHPICARDASFYWYAGEHFRAMAQENVGFVPNPPYRVAEDILRTKPAFIDTAPLGDSILPNPAVEAMLQAEYVPVRSPVIGSWAWLRKDFLARP